MAEELMVDGNKIEEKLKKEQENLMKFKEKRATLDEKNQRM